MINSPANTKNQHLTPNSEMVTSYKAMKQVKENQQASVNN